MLFAVLALSAGLSIEYRSTTLIDGTSPPFMETTWKSTPPKQAIDNVSLTNEGAWRYGHVECRALSKRGRLSNCQIARSDRSDGPADHAALDLTRYFVADSRVMRHRRRIDLITLDIQFKQRGVDAMGDCAPTFCTSIPGPSTPLG